jgi:hypothetical protein
MHHGLSEEQWEEGEWRRDRQMEREWAREDRWPTWRIVRGDGRVEFVKAVNVTSQPWEPRGQDALWLWDERTVMKQLGPHEWRSAALWEWEDEVSNVWLGDGQDQGRGRQ